METISIIFPFLLMFLQVVFLLVLLKVIMVIFALPKQIKTLEQRIERLERKD